MQAAGETGGCFKTIVLLDFSSYIKIITNFCPLHLLVYQTSI